MSDTPFNCNVCENLVENMGGMLCIKFNTLIQHPLSIHKPINFCSYYEEKEEKADEYKGVDEYV